MSKKDRILALTIAMIVIIIIVCIFVVPRPTIAFGYAGEGNTYSSSSSSSKSSSKPASGAEEYDDISNEAKDIFKDVLGAAGNILEDSKNVGSVPAADLSGLVNPISRMIKRYGMGIFDALANFILSSGVILYFHAISGISSDIYFRMWFNGTCFTEGVIRMKRKQGLTVISRAERRRAMSGGNNRYGNDQYQQNQYQQNQSNQGTQASGDMSKFEYVKEYTYEVIALYGFLLIAYFILKADVIQRILYMGLESLSRSIG